MAFSVVSAEVTDTAPEKKIPAISFPPDELLNPSIVTFPVPLRMVETPEVFQKPTPKEVLEVLIS